MISICCSDSIYIYHLCDHYRLVHFPTILPKILLYYCHRNIYAQYMKNMRQQKALHIIHILPCPTVSFLLSFLPLPARSHNSSKQAVLFLYNSHNFYNTRYHHFSHPNAILFIFTWQNTIVRLT